MLRGNCGYRYGRLPRWRRTITAGFQASTFLRGFVRNYAKLLQMDAAPVIAARTGIAAAASNTNYFLSDRRYSLSFSSEPGEAQPDHWGSHPSWPLLLLVYEIYRGNEVSLEKRQTDARAEAGTRTETFSTAAPQLPSSPPAGRTMMELICAAAKEDMPLAKTDTPPKADIPPSVCPVNANVPPAKAGVPSAEANVAFGAFKSERTSGWGSGSSGNRKEISGATGAASFSAIDRSQTRKCASTESGER